MTLAEGPQRIRWRHDRNQPPHHLCGTEGTLPSLKEQIALRYENRTVPLSALTFLLFPSFFSHFNSPVDCLLDLNGLTFLVHNDH